MSINTFAVDADDLAESKNLKTLQIQRPDGPFIVRGECELSTYFNYGAASAIVVIFMIAVIPVMWYQVKHFQAEEAT